MAPKRILVIGGCGLVGNALVRAWQDRGAAVSGTGYHHLLPGFKSLDMADAGAVRRLIRDVRPELVALPAANPYVDFCQTNPAETRKVNVAGSLNVMEAAAEAGAPMIFFSSDYVFDGKKGPYSETDPVSPLSEYGRQKAEVEAAVLARDSRSLVIRSSGVFGWQEEPKNFVLQVRAILGRGQRMKVASDLIYHPTYAENLAEIVAELAAAGRSGLYHVVGADAVARDAFARVIAEAFALDASLLDPVLSETFKAVAPRPKDSRLAAGKARAAVSSPLWGIRRSLEHMLSSEDQWRSRRARGLAAV